MVAYHRLLNNTLDLYMKGDLQKAYNYITNTTCYDTVNEVQIYNFRYSILAAMNKTKEAIDLFEEAIIKKGYWYAYDYLLSDDDLKEMRNDERMQKLLEICKQREVLAKKHATVKLFHHTNNFEQAIIVFHGNQENNKMMPAKWDIEVFKRYDKLFIQSNEMEAALTYNWNNVKLAVNETRELLKRHRTKPYKKYSIAGFSAGANLALHLTLQHPFEIDELILLAPWLPDWDDTVKQLSKLRNTHVIIIVGDKDDDCYENSIRLGKRLEELGKSITMKVVPDMNHMYPDELNHLLQKLK